MSAKTYLLLLSFIISPIMAYADSLEGIRQALLQGGKAQQQEKVYIHTDNSCYFVGDTLWYKAYVVEADKLQPTTLSRILYVELLTPDGMLVERQRIIISPKAFTCGQFILQDSLYSGYYELRAYTRWMLNFNVSHRRFSKEDTWQFYNRQMAADYYRQWDGLYSRVFPVYSKPETPDDYDVRRMYQRPKRRIPTPKKDNLSVTFFPEGGTLLQGVENQVAFEVSDQHGEAIDIQGQLIGGNKGQQSIRTSYMGRGAFLVTPQGGSLKARFTFRGKEYSFPLPKAESEGVAIRLDGHQLSLTSRLPAGKGYAISILCRGILRYFETLSTPLPDHITLPLDSLPTGVNEITLFDSDGRIWASRLFFVNHHDYDSTVVTTSALLQQTYAPYERIDYPVSIAQVTGSTVFSLAIRDTQTDEPTYDDGNVMTDLLLSSELKGFIAHPAHYFESDDADHRHHLDLLMLVQGWRKYQWHQLADTTFQLRYQPEKSMTVSGSVYKMLDIQQVEPEEMANWPYGLGMTGRKVLDDSDVQEESETSEVPDIQLDYATMNRANDHLGINHNPLKKEVLVEAEVIMDNGIAAAVQKTDQGRFLFQIPPFYGATYLNLKAYQEKDSLKKSMTSRKDADIFKETAYPDFYVKCDIPYPVFSQPYSYYQKHAPEWNVTIDEDSLSEFTMENDVHQLQNVNVKGRRRGLRGIDWTKPAYVCDAYDLYNLLTDYGLSFGYYDIRQFPRQAANFLYGNMNRYNTFHVDGRLDGFTYWRNYSPVDAHAGTAERAGLFQANRTPQSLLKSLRLGRLQHLRFFSDYEPRMADSTLVEERYSADAVIEMVPIADDGKQLVYRDRHIFLKGFNTPVSFYQPDYSQRQPDTPSDYRRTLYWNPNAVTDETGHFTATFYNSSKSSRLKMSAAGVTPDGHLLYSR